MSIFLKKSSTFIFLSWYYAFCSCTTIIEKNRMLSENTKEKSQDKQSSTTTDYSMSNDNDFNLEMTVLPPLKQDFYTPQTNRPENVFCEKTNPFFLKEESHELNSTLVLPNSKKNSHTQNSTVSIRKIYLDMDGVISAFDDGLQKYHREWHNNPDNKEHNLYKKYEQENIKSLIEVGTSSNSYIKKIIKLKGFEPGDIFDEFILDKQFETLEPEIGTKEGIEYLLKLWELGIITQILSSTSSEERHHKVVPQKFLWLKKMDICLWPILVPGSNEKKQYANEGYLLIDDYRKNIDEWVENGGIGILHKSWSSTLQILKSSLDLPYSI